MCISIHIYFQLETVKLLLDAKANIHMPDIFNEVCLCAYECCLWKDPYLNVYVDVYMNIYMYIYMYIFIDILTCVYIYICINKNIHTYIYRCILT